MSPNKLRTLVRRITRDFWIAGDHADAFYAGVTKSLVLYVLRDNPGKTLGEIIELIGLSDVKPRVITSLTRLLSDEEVSNNGAKGELRYREVCKTTKNFSKKTLNERNPSIFQAEDFVN